MQRTITKALVGAALLGAAALVSDAGALPGPGAGSSLEAVTAPSYPADARFKGGLALDRHQFAVRYRDQLRPFRSARSRDQLRPFRSPSVWRKVGRSVGHGVRRIRRGVGRGIGGVGRGVGRVGRGIRNIGRRVAR
jgi:hypothetical protein